MKVNQTLQNKHKENLKKEDVKGKAVVQLDDSMYKEEKSTPGKPRTRGLKRAHELQKEVSPPRSQITVNDLIVKEINANRVYWHEKVYHHLEKLLKKARIVNNLKIHMAMHYRTKKRVAQVRIKQLKKKLKETLISQKEKYKLDILDETSLMA